MPRRLLAAAALLAGLALLPAGSAAARDRCALDRFEQRVLTTRLVRILTLEDDLTTVACWRATGRRTQLVMEDGKYGTGSIDAVAGRYVAASYVETVGCPYPGCGEPSETQAATTSVVDARTGRTRRLTDGEVASLRLRADGVVVWTTGLPPTRTLHAWDRDGQRVLDTGAIAIGEVAVAGRVRWTRDGVARSAAVRALGR